MAPDLWSSPNCCVCFLTGKSFIVSHEQQPAFSLCKADNMFKWNMYCSDVLEYNHNKAIPHRLVENYKIIMPRSQEYFRTGVSRYNGWYWFLRLQQKHVPVRKVLNLLKINNIFLFKVIMVSLHMLVYNFIIYIITCQSSSYKTSCPKKENNISMY